VNWTEILSAAATLFLVLDAPGNIPVFNAILSKLDHNRRSRVIAREMLIALVILVGFLFAGNVILSFLGLSQSSLNISGGVLLFIISLRMIFPGRQPYSDQETEDPFIVPIAVPLTAGPSTIAILLFLGSSQPERIWEWCIALIIAWLGSAILLVLSPRLIAVIGERGARAMERLIGMILVILAVQMLLNGIRDFIQSL
jgi:multiple antibiotic resistance protein